MHLFNIGDSTFFVDIVIVSLNTQIYLPQMLSTINEDILSYRVLRPTIVPTSTHLACRACYSEELCGHEDALAGRPPRDPGRLHLYIVCTGGHVLQVYRARCGRQLRRTVARLMSLRCDCTLRALCVWMNRGVLFLSAHVSAALGYLAPAWCDG